MLKVSVISDWLKIIIEDIKVKYGINGALNSILVILIKGVTSNCRWLCNTKNYCSFHIWMVFIIE